MAKCEWIGGIKWPAFAVGVEVLRRRDILAPDCQDLYCRGVVPVIIEEDFCSARRVYVSISCDLCLPGVAIRWLTGGCQESV
jgi:hypothetical protein